MNIKVFVQLSFKKVGEGAGRAAPQKNVVWCRAPYVIIKTGKEVQKMKLGANTKCFGGRTIRETAELFAACGLNCAELCFCLSDLSGWRYNYCGKYELPGPLQLSSAVNIFCEYGIEVSAIGIYNCLLCEKDNETFDSLTLFAQYCDLAAECGIKNVTTCAGKSGRMPHSKSFDSVLLERLYENFLYCLIEAEKYGITVSLECNDSDVLTSYEDYLALRCFTEKAIGRSSMLKYISNPAFDKGEALNSEIGLYHIKDRKKNGIYFDRFGEGDADFSHFSKKLPDTPDAPIIFEYVNSENLADTVRSFKDFLKNSK